MMTSGVITLQKVILKRDVKLIFLIIIFAKLVYPIRHFSFQITLFYFLFTNLGVDFSIHILLIIFPEYWKFWKELSLIQNRLFNFYEYVNFYTYLTNRHTPIYTLWLYSHIRTNKDAHIGKLHWKIKQPRMIQNAAMQAVLSTRCCIHLTRLLGKWSSWPSECISRCWFSISNTLHNIISKYFCSPCGSNRVSILQVLAVKVVPCLSQCVSFGSRSPAPCPAKIYLSPYVSLIRC